MSVLNIRILPDPVLRRKALKVKMIDNSTKKLVDRMFETLHAVPGRAGLAAPQIGVSLRVIVIDVPEGENICLINPGIIKKSGERIIDEGCLSIPGYIGEVKRAETVTVKGKNQSGSGVRIKAEGILAQALEHGIDHINGILYIDHLESPDKLRKLEPMTPEEVEEEEAEARAEEGKAETQATEGTATPSA